MSAKKLIFMAACLVAVLLLLLPVANSLTSSLGSISVKDNPQLLRRVELIRNNRMEYLYFRVRLNDRALYKTKIFRRNKATPMDYREQIVWHPNGDSFFLEVAGTRIWGYDVLEARELSPGELAAIPVASFEETRYTGSLPGEPPKSATAPLPAHLRPIPDPVPLETNRPTGDVRRYFDFPPETDQ